MPYFTPELSCTDGSTDACIFLPSVHPTLYKRVGPTRHNSSAQSLTPNPNLQSVAGRTRRACTPSSLLRHRRFSSRTRARASSAGLPVLAAGHRTAPPPPKLTSAQGLTSPRVTAAAAFPGRPPP
jgi:hypothetical protein